MLAGVGSVTLVDDAPCSGRDPGNFLIPHDIDPSQTVAEASVATLQEMNPLVTVGAVPGSPSTYVTEASVAGYNLVLLVGQPGHVVSHADSACTKAGVPFLAACCRGFSGWAFANLHSHDYIVEVRVASRGRRVDSLMVIRAISSKKGCGPSIER